MTSIRVAASAALVCLFTATWAQAQSSNPRASTPAAKPGVPEQGRAEARFPATLQLAGHTLRLNGKGTRYRAVVSVYDIGLYTGSKVGSLEQLLADPAPKRIQLSTLRRLTGDSLGVAMVQGMQANAPPSEKMKLFGHMDRLGKIFASEPEVPAGAQIVIDYVPGSGTVFLLNGVQKGDVVADPGYFASIARIWLGAKPVDGLLKDALLGIESKRAESGGG